MNHEGSGDKEVPDIPPPEADDSKADDSKADEEEKVFDSPSDYEKKAREKDRQRGEELKDALHALVRSGIVVVGLLLISSVVIWAYHVLTPYNWHWLVPEQLQEMQKIMSSALLALVVSDYAKKYF